MLNWIAILGSLGAGLATALGALPIYFKKEYSKETLDIGLGFSAGIMLVAAFVSLILPGIKYAEITYQSKWALVPVLVGLVIGYLFIILIHNRLPHEHFNKSTDTSAPHNLSRISLIIIAIALHNIPEGLAVGVGFASGQTSAGVAIALAIGIQNIPEGLIVAFGLLREGSSKNRAFMMALLSGLVEPLAALLGYLGTAVSESALPVALAFAGGAMLFVICQEIFPELFRQGHEKNATIGVISGVIVMLIINFYFN